MPHRRKSPKFYTRLSGVAVLVCLFFAVFALTGCDHFRGHDEVEKVYVLPREKFLKDRIAVLANTTAKVTNGEPLEVLDRSRRFIHVKTPNGETGWIEEATVATQHTVDQFNSLSAENKSDTTVAMATVSSESRMHLHPGRTESWLYLAESGEKLHLLKRAIVPKSISQAITASGGKAGSESGEGKSAAPADGQSADGAEANEPATPAIPMPAVPMEDWWLARDANGRTGWVLARSLDVDVPDAMLKLGQGERFMGVYPLDTVHDDDSGGDPTVTEYAVAYAPNHGGLLYDFDTVVVYTWNTKKHRYEGAYRDRDVEGFLPMTVTHEIPPVTNTKKLLPPEPVFHYKVLPAGGDITLPQPDPQHPDASDADMGVPHPSALLDKAYRLEINHVVAVGPTIKPSEEAHPVPEKKSEKKFEEKKKKRR